MPACMAGWRAPPAPRPHHCPAAPKQEQRLPRVSRGDLPCPLDGIHNRSTTPMSSRRHPQQPPRDNINASHPHSRMRAFGVASNVTDARWQWNISARNPQHARGRELCVHGFWSSGAQRDFILRLTRYILLHVQLGRAPSHLDVTGQIRGSTNARGVPLLAEVERFVVAMGRGCIRLRF